MQRFELGEKAVLHQTYIGSVEWGDGNISLIALRKNGNIMNVGNLRLSAMRSLWGIVTPNLRKVSIQEKDHLISLYFYYDQEPSEEEIDLSEDAATEVIADFSEPFLISSKRLVIAYPEKIIFEGYLIYSRFEN